MRAWQAKWDSADTGRFAHSIFPDVTLRHWGPKGGEKVCLHCVESFIWTLLCSIASWKISNCWKSDVCVCVCAGDYETVNHLIWHCERFRLKRHHLIDALNVSIGIPTRDLCALKKWCVVKCCLDFLEGFGIKLWWFGPSPVFTRSLNGFGQCQWSNKILLLRYNKKKRWIFNRFWSVDAKRCNS
jgi:hypothetical protein